MKGKKSPVVRNVSQNVKRSDGTKRRDAKALQVASTLRRNRGWPVHQAPFVQPTPSCLPQTSPTNRAGAVQQRSDDDSRSIVTFHQFPKTHVFDSPSFSNASDYPLQTDRRLPVTLTFSSPSAVGSSALATFQARRRLLDQFIGRQARLS